jgi:hypothetical protein
MAMSDRIALAMAVVAALEAANRRQPGDWHKVAIIGKRVAIEDPVQFSQALHDAATLGLLQVYGDRVRLIDERYWADA